MGLSESSFWAYALGSSPGKRLIKVLEVCILAVLVADNAMRDRVWKLGLPLRIHITDGPTPADFVPCCEHMGVAQGNIWALVFVGAPETGGLYDAREDARVRGWALRSCSTTQQSPEASIVCGRIKRKDTGW